MVIKMAYIFFLLANEYHSREFRELNGIEITWSRQHYIIPIKIYIWCRYWQISIKSIINVFLSIKILLHMYVHLTIEIYTLSHSLIHSFILHLTCLFICHLLLTDTWPRSPLLLTSTLNISVNIKLVWCNWTNQQTL